MKKYDSKKKKVEETGGYHVLPIGWKMTELGNDSNDASVKKRLLQCQIDWSTYDNCGDGDEEVNTENQERWKWFRNW